jgi:hypothetical protein
VDDIAICAIVTYGRAAKLLVLYLKVSCQAEVMASGLQYFTKPGDKIELSQADNGAQLLRAVKELKWRTSTAALSNCAPLSA